MSSCQIGKIVTFLGMKNLLMAEVWTIFTRQIRKQLGIGGERINEKGKKNIRQAGT
jgi:hypothetical protein